MCRSIFLYLSLTLVSLFSFLRPQVQHIAPAELESPQLPWPLSSFNQIYSEDYESEELSSEGLIHAATNRTKLLDFGDEDLFPFREGLQVLLDDATEASKNMSAYGARHLNGMVVEALSNRLKMEELVKRHPEILDEEIDRPIWIIGTPRSGATHLHSLLAQHSKLRAPLLYEMMEPVLTDSDEKALKQTGLDPRVARCTKRMNLIHILRPKLKVMQMDGAEDPVDESMATLPIFRSAHFGMTIPLQRYMKWYLKQDKTEEFSYLRMVLQVLQWQASQQGKPRKRWVLKGQSHTVNIPFLVRIFPTAELVHLHRDPTAVVPAYLTYLTYSQGLFSSYLDLKRIGRDFEMAFDSFIHRSVSVRHYNLDLKATDIYFDDLVKDSSLAAKQVLNFADEDSNAKDWLAMTSFAANHKRYRDGHIEYDLTTFGLQEEPLRKKFDFYREHFHISWEAVVESGRTPIYDEL